jgi:hypothetical protein
MFSKIYKHGEHARDLFILFWLGGGMFKQPRSSSENNVVRIHYGVNA